MKPGDAGLQHRLTGSFDGLFPGDPSIDWALRVPCGAAPSPGPD